MRLLRPFLSDEQQHRARRDVDDAVQDAFPPVARDGDANLLPAPTITTVKRRSLRDDYFIKHQDDGAFLKKKPAFQPPFACRQNLARKLKRWRGRFQLISRRASARLTEGRETTIW